MIYSESESFKTEYNSPFGKYILVANRNGLIGLYLQGQRYFADNLIKNSGTNFNLEIFEQTICWLDEYFAGKRPNIKELKILPRGNFFRQTVWNLLCQIPYGETITYKQLAEKTALALNKPRMSAQAVGGAVGHNPISIIIPCHRVVGTNRRLIGYAGGVEVKAKLLELEGVKL